MASARPIFSLVLVAALLAAQAQAAASVTVKLGLLAVDAEEARGMVIYAYLSVALGSGQVIVEPAGLVDEMIVVSTKLARTEAAVLAGLNPETVAVNLTIETSTNVGGPSASGFIASVLYDILSGLHPLTDRVTMTGMVSLTGLILPVAGVRYKVTAAAQHGFTEVLLPEIEAVQVNDSAITVAGVCDILDAGAAVAGAAGQPGPRLLVNTSTAPGSEAFRRAAEEFIAYAERLAPMLDNTTAARVAMFLEHARRLLDTSPYSAASLAFHAVYTAASSVAKSRGIAAVEDALGVNVAEAIAEARAVLDTRVAELAGGRSCDLWKLFSLAAAAYRLDLAEEVRGSDDVLALLRALSARLWAETGDTLHGPAISCDRLGTAVEAVVRHAEEGYDYIQMLVNRRLVTVGNITLDQWIKKMKQYMDNGEYVHALGLAMYIIGDIETRLASTASPNCVARHAERLLATSWAAAFPALHFLDYGLAYYEEVEKDPGMLVYMAATAAAWSFATREVLLVATPTAAASNTTAHATVPAATAGAPGPQIGTIYAVAAAAALVSAATVRASAPPRRSYM